MNFIILFTLFPGLTAALIVHDSVIFHKANEIAVIRSKWLSTFIIDLKPYENFFNKLLEDLRKAAHSIEQFYDFLSKLDYKE